MKTKLNAHQVEEVTEFYQRENRRSKWGIGLEVLAALLFLAFVIFMLAVVGCNTALTLGPYKGDTFLYEADHTLVQSKLDLSAFLLWEVQNRNSLTGKLHAVTTAADTIRDNAPLWFTNAWTLRNVYSNAHALGASPAVITSASNNLLSSVSALQAQSLTSKSLTTVNLH